jgi:DNA ligase-1
MSDNKPMLAKDPKQDADGNPIITYPVLVQPKLDGIRAMVIGGKLLSRSLKPIPNKEICAALERPEYEGFDGEILVGDPRVPDAFQITTSYVRGANKTGAEWTYNVFDLCNHAGTNMARRTALAQFFAQPKSDPRVVRVPDTLCKDADELRAFEQECLNLGFEGAIARVPLALYKHGRSTPGSGPLWKIKRFIDFEAEVVGVYEEMHNGNVAMTNALGRTERSSAAAGKTGKGTLGGLELRALNGPHEGQRFRCGTGFNAEQRASLWIEATHGPDGYGARGLNERVAKIKSFPIGVKDAPRFPVFLGWREDWDQS